MATHSGTLPGRLRRIPRRFGVRLVASMLIVSLPLAVALTVLLTARSSASLNAAAADKGVSLARAVTLRVEDWLLERREGMSVLAVTAADNLRPERLAVMLDPELEKAGSDEIVASDPQGQLIYSTQMGKLQSDVALLNAGAMRSRIDNAAIRSANASGQLGAVAVPADVLERAEGGLVLTVEERDLLARLPQITDRVLAGIPRIEEVRAAILSQGARFDGLAPNDKRAGAAIPFGGRVLRVAADFDILESAGRDPGDALAVMRRRLGVYDPALLEALESVLADRARRVPHKLSTAELRPGMVLVEDVVTEPA